MGKAREDGGRGWVGFFVLMSRRVVVVVVVLRRVMAFFFNRTMGKRERERVLLGINSTCIDQGRSPARLDRTGTEDDGSLFWVTWYCCNKSNTPSSEKSANRVREVLCRVGTLL